MLRAHSSLLVKWMALTVGKKAKKIGSFSLIERVILSAGAMLIFSVWKIVSDLIRT